MTQQVEINAAILERQFGTLADKVAHALEIGVDCVQIDVCDGRFVPSKTFMSAGCSDSAKRIAMLAGRDAVLELDMMIDWETPISGRFEKWLRAVTTIAPDRMVMHMDSTSSYEEIFAVLNDVDISFGLGVHLHHTLEDIETLIENFSFSYIQVMGIEKVGFGGQKLSPKVFERLGELRAIYPTMSLAVDGGVKVENAGALVAAGANRLALGSGLFGTLDVSKRLKDLRRVVNGTSSNVD